MHSDPTSPDPTPGAAGIDLEAALGMLPAAWQRRAGRHLGTSEAMTSFDRMTPHQVAIRLLKLIDAERAVNGARPPEESDPIDPFIWDAEDDDLAVEALAFFDICMALPPIPEKEELDNVALLTLIDEIITAGLGQASAAYVCSAVDTCASISWWLLCRDTIIPGRYDGVPKVGQAQSGGEESFADEVARVLAARGERLGEYWDRRLWG